MSIEQHRKSPRARFIDYESGDYFITICTANHEHSFGEIINDKMRLSELGQFVDNQLKEASAFCPWVNILVHVVMPNHIHAIVSVQRELFETYFRGNFMQRTPNPMLRDNPTEQRVVTPLSRYVNSLKGSITRYARSRKIAFRWQSRYHDHAIRSHSDGNNIANYIQTNVIRWSLDCFNSKRRAKIDTPTAQTH